MQYIACHKPKNNHNSINQILSGRAAVFLSAECGQDEENCKPDDELISSEHAKRTQ